MSAHLPDEDRPWLRHYDYWVPHHLTYPARPLCEILDATAVDVPDRPATVFLGATLTFAQIKAQSDRLARTLERYGLQKGDRVGIMLPNCPQYLVVAFAVLRHGAVVVNVNPGYTAREVLEVAADSGMRLLFTLDRLTPLALAVKEQTSIERVVVTSLDEYSFESAPAPHVAGTISLGEWIASADSRDVVPVPIDPDDLAVLQYTGGTTGTPKGAMLTHRNLFANVVQTEAFMDRNRSRREERYLMVVPFFHIYGFTVGMLKGVWVGALQILIPKYDVELVLTALRDAVPTYFPAVPTIFASLLGHPKAGEFGLGKVRIFTSGGAPCPVQIIDEWERTFGRPLYEGYGLSETSPVTHSTAQLARRKPGTVGLPLPDTDMKIVDVETGERELPTGEAGELCVCGPQVMAGYWRQPGESATVLRADAAGTVCFHTGDIARVDEDGYTTIVQRKKDMIIVDGFNVYPTEVEAVLCTHPAVRQAAVIGLPDAHHGEIVKAWVVLKEGASVSGATLHNHCRLSLAAYKVPRQIEQRHDLPVSAVGKLLYRALRAEALSLPGPSGQ